MCGARYIQRRRRELDGFSMRFRLWALFLAALPLVAAAPKPSAEARGVNLRGEVMILVYHKFGPADGRWTRSFDSFSQDLARLDAAGYRPITLRQYVTGDFALPAGASPVVLTFDDGSAYQMRFGPDGKLSADSAVGRWAAFAAQHPEFPVHGTFFINPGDDVFGQRAFIQAKLRMLVQMGSEVGNHTLTHSNLSKLSDAAIEREIGMGQYDIDRWLPGYQVVSLALPYGIFPKPPALAAAGAWTGTPGTPQQAQAHRSEVTVRWHYPAVVKVGAGPAPSPLVAGLAGDRLPRIQVFRPEFDKWMAYFAAHPAQRFVSDGERHAAGSLPAAAGSRRPRLASLPTR